MKGINLYHEIEAGSAEEFKMVVDLPKFQNKYESEQGIWKGKSSLLTNLLLSVLIALPTAYVFASYEHLMLLIKAMGCKFTMFLFIFFSVTLLLVIASLIDLPKNYLRELNFKK